MTDPLESMMEGVPGLAHHLAEPVRVKVVNTEPRQTEKHAPEYGAIFAVFFQGTEASTQLVPQSPQRDHATISIAAGAANNQVGLVYIGTKNVLDNMSAANQGSVFQLAYGQSFTWGNQGPLYARPDGTNSLKVNVLDERWE